MRTSIAGVRLSSGRRHRMPPKRALPALQSALPEDVLARPVFWPAGAGDLARSRLSEPQYRIACRDERRSRLS
jgi:hypothetical protein